MSIQIKVSFPRQGTAASTIVSLASLLKQIPGTGKVLRAFFDNRRLVIEIDSSVDGLSDIQMKNQGLNIELSLKDLCVESLKIALTQLINKVSSLQIQSGEICDVKHLSLREFILSIEMERSSFKSQHSIVQTIDEVVSTNDNPQEQVASSHRLLVIDLSNMINACYYATAAGKQESEITRSSTGVYTNAVKGALDRFISIVRKYDPSHCLLALDPEDRTTLKRREIYAAYKENREGKDKPLPLVDQIPLVYELFEKMNLPMVQAEKMEADDVIASVTRKWIEENRGDVIILSADQDLHQLLGDNVIQVITGNQEVTRASFIEKRGIEPTQFADYKALCGEISDNIPGVPGIGDKTAVKLLQRYQSLEGILDNVENITGKAQERLLENKHAAIMSKELAILYDIPQTIELDSFQLNVNKEGMRSVLERLEIGYTTSRG